MSSDSENEGRRFAVLLSLLSNFKTVIVDDGYLLYRGIVTFYTALHSVALSILLQLNAQR